MGCCTHIADVELIGHCGPTLDEHVLNYAKEHKNKDVRKALRLLTQQYIIHSIELVEPEFEHRFENKRAIKHIMPHWEIFYFSPYNDREMFVWKLDY